MGYAFFTRWEIAFFNEVVDHALQTEGTPVVRSIDSGNAIVHQFLYFFGKDDAATASKDPDVRGPSFPQQIVHVFEVFIVATLVAGDGDRLRILLNGSVHHFYDTSIVPKMNYLTACRLNYPAHDVNGGIMSIEQARGGHNPDFIFWLI